MKIMTKEKKETAKSKKTSTKTTGANNDFLANCENLINVVVKKALIHEKVEVDLGEAYRITEKADRYARIDEIKSSCFQELSETDGFIDK